MYSYFSDLHVQLLARGILQPGEQLVGQTVTQYSPWWALGIIRKTFLVLATDQRLVLVEHRMMWLHQANKLHSVDSLPWPSVQETKLKGIFSKKIRVRGQGERGPVNVTMKVPNQLFGLLAPMRNNMLGARAVTGAFDTARQQGALPAASGYGAPPAMAPYGVSPQLPAQNAPGYASVPPASAGYGQYQQQQQQQPSQPQQPVAQPPGPGYPPRWPS